MFESIGRDWSGSDEGAFWDRTFRMLWLVPYGMRECKIRWANILWNAWLLGEYSARSFIYIFRATISVCLQHYFSRIPIHDGATTWHNNVCNFSLCLYKSLCSFFVSQSWADRLMLPSCTFRKAKLLLTTKGSSSLSTRKASNLSKRMSRFLNQQARVSPFFFSRW